MVLLSNSIGVYAFVILKDGLEDTAEESIVKTLKELVKKKIATFAIPNAFLVRHQ